MLYAKFDHPEAGWDRGEFCKKNLTIGNMYEVEYVSMGQSYTDIYLKGYKVPFNSVNFTFFKNGEEWDIYSDPNYNPYI